MWQLRHTSEIQSGKHTYFGYTLLPFPDWCRACSTAECTATNILAPIAHAHRAASHTPCSLLPAPCSCSSLALLCSSCSLLLMLPALHSCSLHSHSSRSCSLCSCSLCSCSLHSCSLCSQLPFRLWRCSRTFPSTTCACYSIFRLCFSVLSLAPWTLPLLV